MAEALMKAHHGDRFKASSAGTFATEVHPLARIVMNELGIDLSGHSSTTTEAVSAIIFDVVVTVCDEARDNCPYFPSAKKKVHKAFEDPSAAQGTHAERLASFRKTRDEIRLWMTSWVDTDLAGS